MTIVNQTKVHDVDGDFRVVTGLERFPHFLFQLFLRERSARRGRGGGNWLHFDTQRVGVLRLDAKHVAIDDDGVGAAERLRDVRGLAFLQCDLGADGNHRGFDIARQDFLFGAHNGISLVVVAVEIKSGLFVFRGDRRGLAFQRADQSVPRQNRALHARRIFVDAREHRELAHITVHFAGRDHVAHLLESFFRLGLRLALDVVREQRGRRLRDAASRTDKTRVLDDIAIEREK